MTKPLLTRTPQAPLAAGWLEGLSPAYFGLVMATGIVSLAAHLLALPQIARGLFALNLVFYAVLWGLTLLRLLRHPRACLADLADHRRAPGFFTLVAGSGVLGSQVVILAGATRAGLALWLLALLLWGLLTYAVFTAFTIKRDKPALAEGIGGSWLLAVVATQAIAVLGALLAERLVSGGVSSGGMAPWRPALDFLALAMWLWGGMLYSLIMALIFYRLTFFRLAPEELTPPYWINMGAMAISTLAGALLIANAGTAPLLAELLPFIKGITLFYWAAGSWWIPLLLALGVWRHLVRRHPLRYDPLYWGAVFPLGMYAAGTHEMIAALRLDFLAFLPPLFLYAALAAWTAAFAGLLRGLRPRR